MAESLETNDFDGSIFEELEALRAIYMDEVKINTTKMEVIKVIYQMDHTKKIVFYLSNQYPIAIPTIKCSNKDNGLVKLLENSASERVGTPMLYSLVSTAVEYWNDHSALDNNNSGKNAEKDVEVLQFVKKNDQDERKSAHHSKVKTKKKKKIDINNEKKSSFNTKKKSMRTAIDVINRILWDNSLPTEDFIVGYLDRFIGVIEKPFSAFSWEDLASVDYNVLAIPKHRIQYFKYKQTKIWDKNDRMDKVYGSTGHTETLTDIMECYKDIKEHIVEKTEDQVVEEKTKSYNDKDRPNYFMCLPITSMEIKENMRKVQDHILSCDDRLEDGIIRTSLAHITICMMRLENDDDKEKAAAVLIALEGILVCMLPLDKAGLTVKRVDNFRGLVVHAEIQHRNVFHKFAEIAKAKLKDAGIRLVGNHEVYRPHMTLLKLNRPLCKQLEMDSISPFLYEHFKNTYFGQQPVYGLRICSTGKERGDDGFYVTIGNLHNSLFCISDKLPSLIYSYLKKLLHARLIPEELCNEYMAGLLSNDKKIFEKTALSFEKSLSSMDSGQISKGTVLILRGLPGSGKSHFVQHLLNSEENDLSIKVCNADGYFKTNDSYAFSGEKISAAHAYCRDRFFVGMEEEANLIIVDNTHSQRWEYQIYERLALLCGYKCSMVEILCEDETQRQRYCKRGIHQVTDVIHKEMFLRWELDNNAAYITSDSDISIIDIMTKDLNEIKAKSAHSSTAQDVLYSALYFDECSQKKLLKHFPPNHGVISGDHMTISHAPTLSDVKNTPVGKHSRVKVTGFIENGYIQAVLVEELDEKLCTLKLPHVTLSRDKKTPAKHAQKWLEKESIKTLEEEVILSGVVGVQIAISASVSKMCTDPQQFSAFLDTLCGPENEDGIDYLHDGSDEENQDHVEKEAGMYFGPRVVKSLYIFDFDGTLFHTPGPAEGRKQYQEMTGTPWPYEGWLSKIQSLQSPLHVHAGPSLKEYFDHKDRACSMSVLLTARIEDLREAVKSITLENGMSFGRFMLKPTTRSRYSGDVNKYKRNYVNSLLKAFPSVKEVKFWDDQSTNVDSVRGLAYTHPGIDFQLFHVREKLPDPYKMTVECMLDRMGCRQTEAYKLAVSEGISFIAAAWNDVAGTANGVKEILPFGSYVLTRRTDVDLCILAPNDKSVDQYIKLLAEKLKTYGVKYINVASGIRCPRLKIKFEYINSSPIEFDIVIAAVMSSCNTHIKSLYKQCDDKTSKRALDGLIFLEDVVRPVESRISLDDFGMIIDVVCAVLSRKRLKGNAFHCIRTFHLVHMLSRFILELSIDLFVKGIESMKGFEKVLMQFFKYLSEVNEEEWRTLFKGFVPELYIQPLVECFRESSRSSIQQLLFMAPNSIKTKGEIRLKLTTSDPVAMWKGMVLAEARLGTLIRTLIQRGLKVYPGVVLSDSIYFGTSSLEGSKKLVQSFTESLQNELGDVIVTIIFK